MINFLKKFLSPSFSLFSSFTTLICCALPSLLVTLGMGATLASVISIFPWITIISEYKIGIFLIAGMLITISCYLFWHGRNASCPIDPIEAKICKNLRFINLLILISSSIIYFIGFFFAFIAVYILY